MSVCGYWHRTPEPCTVVTLGDIEMVSSGAGLYGITAPIDGWANAGVSSGGPVPYGNADGGIMGDTFFQGRSLTIEGDIEARDHAEFADAVEQLGAVLAHPRTGLLEVDETVHLGLVRQIEVTRTRPVQISQLGPKHGIFTIQLEAAAFPRVDVEEQSAVITSAGVTLTNHGNYPAELVVEMRGPLTRPVGLEWDGGAWEFAASLNATLAIDVNMGKRLITSPDSFDHYRQYASGRWLTLPPGSTTVRRVGGGSGSLRAVWRSTWS